MTKQTRLNFLVDATTFLGFVMMAISGILFLVRPSNDALTGLHAFGSAMTFVAIAIYIVRHWQWIKTMTRRSVEFLTSKSVTFPKSIRFNVVIDALISVFFPGYGGFGCPARSEVGKL